MNIKNIIASNALLGVKTSFFNEDNGILGYTENGIIYLNEFYSDDLELVNKHEVLHLYEDSKQFKGVKKVVFDILGEEELNKLRNQYYLKYNVLYSEEEIKNGILDNEIVIDIIIGNGNFPIDIKEYFSDVYKTIVNKSENMQLTTKGKRFLSLNLNKNLVNRYPYLSKWEQIFVDEYYKDREKPTGENRHNKVGLDIISAYDKLRYSIGEKHFKIDVSNNPYLVRKLNNQILSLRAKGEFEKAEELVLNKDKALNDLATQINISLYDQYRDIVKLLDDNHYNKGFKYLILKETLTKTYRYENGHRVVDKRDLHKTILPHMILNKFMLDYIYDNVNQYKSFTDLYFDALEKYNKEFLNNKDVIFKQNENGYWIKFEGGKISQDKLNINSKNLANLIADTPWCTRKNPKEHLEGGDFYVFVDEYKIPHIAIKMNGDSIDELRGIKGGVDQEIEDEYRKIAIEFLKDNPHIDKKSRWLEKEERNERLNNYLIKIKTNNLNEDDINDLIQDINHHEDKLHGDINSNERKIIEEISKNEQLLNKISESSELSKKSLRIIKDIKCNNRILIYIEQIQNGTLKEQDFKQLYFDLFHDFESYRYIENQETLEKLINSTDNPFKEKVAQYFECEKDEIYIGKNCTEECFGNICPYKVIAGDLKIINSKKGIDFSNLTYVVGNLNLWCGKNIKAPNLVEVGGDLDVSECTGDFSSLSIVNGNLSAYRIESELPSLKFVGCDADFAWTEIEKFDFLEEVCGNLTISYSKIKKLNKLKFVGGIMEAQYCDGVDLSSLESFERCNGLEEEFIKNYKYDSKREMYVKNNLKK